MGILLVMLSAILSNPLLSWILTRILLHKQLFCFSLNYFFIHSFLRSQGWKSQQPSPLPQLNYCFSQILLTWIGSHSPRGTQFSKNCKWVDADHVFSRRNNMQIWIHTTWFQLPKRKHGIKQSITQVGLSAYSNLRYVRSQASQQHPFHPLANIQMVLAVLRVKCPF